ncbi:MAG: DNA repair protein RadA [Candidatus Nanopelagicales bacterium]|nr:DNA repair protein RadA [Candidatus Nanopelagicales bacterium]
MGKCPACEQFATLSEIVSQSRPKAGSKTRGPAGAPTRSARPVVDLRGEHHRRLGTGVGEFDRVLGGGLVAGQVVLVAGEPGVGKSTLLLDVGHRFARANGNVLYVSGEESAEQIALRAQRIGALHQNLLIADETELEQLLAHLSEVRPALLIVDSVQTIATASIDSRAGGVAQVHEVTQVITQWAKSRSLPTLLVGQSTRENSVAGPRALEHLVDTVVTFEGDRTSALRLLRSVKNRFGPTDEVACFEHDEDGLREVADPSFLFRKVREQPVPGSCLTVTLEGRRPMLAEVQALVAPTAAPAPRRSATGLELNRTTMLVTVTEKAGRLSLSNRDVYAATVGGARLSDPGADLAVCLAVASARLDAPLWPDTVAIGEVTLSGDLRVVPGLGQRVAEAARLGFKTVVIPADAGGHPEVVRAAAGLDVLPIHRLSDLLEVMTAAPISVSSVSSRPVNAPF